SLSACLPRWCVKVAPFPLQFALRQREHPCAPLHSSRSPIRGSELEQEASSCWPLQFCSSPKSQTGARLTSSSAQCPGTTYTRGRRFSSLRFLVVSTPLANHVLSICLTCLRSARSSRSRLSTSATAAPIHSLA